MPSCHTPGQGEQTYQEVKEIQRRYTPRHWPPAPQSQPCDSNATRTWFLFSNRPTGSSVPPHSPLTSQSSGPNAFKLSTTSSRVPVSDPLPHISPAEAPLSPIWDDHELSPKIREACAFARANGYRYLWIDSCCIDKTSSVELSEAINSMYQWYTYAEVCYAYLADVTAKEDAYAMVSTFRCSRWFSRGWTLQELIAPAHVEFLAKDWTPIGSKRSLGTLVSTITNIHYTALLRLEPLSEFSVAQRLSWASRRQTTRVEDRAYSLLGIFDINMPLLYGEGERAFRRLQEEIMRRIPDQSLFSWSWSDSYLSFHSLRGQVERGHDRFRYDPNLCGRANTDAHESLLAPSPDLFRHCGRIEAVPHHEVTRQLQLGLDVPTPSYDFTPHGIRTQLPMIPLSLYLGADSPLSGWYLVVLGCEHSGLPGHLLGRVCHIPTSTQSIALLYCGHVTVPSNHPSRTDDRSFAKFLPLSLSLGGIGTQAAQLHSLQIDLKTIHIPYPDRIDAPRVVAFRKTHERFHLILPKKTRRALCAQGYSPSLKGGDAARPTIQWLALLHRDKSHSVLIKFQHTLDSDGVTLSLEAYVWLAEPRGLHERPDLWELVSWTDSYPWAQVLDKRAVAVTADSRTLKVTLELHLVSPDHYVPHVEIPHVEIPHVEIPHVEIHDESDIVQPSSDWPRLLTSIGSQSESIGTSCERRTQTKEYWEKGERVEADHLETRGEGGGSTDGKGAGPSWWAVPCDF